MLYNYEASDAQGVITSGVIDVIDKERVIEHLQKKNLIPISVVTNESARKIQILSIGIFERVTPLDHIFLVRNLSAIIKAGLNILEALDIMIEDATKGIIKTVLKSAKSNLENGQPLSFTFAEYTKYFPVVFVGMVRAGEATGKLAESLDELNQHITREYNLGKKIKSALAYPAILFVGASGIVLLMLLFVVPRLGKLFSQSNIPLPWITQLLLSSSSAIVSHPFVVVLLLALIVGMFMFFKQSLARHRAFSSLLFSIPVVNNLVKKVILVRFTRTMGSLIASGTPMIESLRLAGEAVSNHYYHSAVMSVLNQVSNGVPLSKSLASFPNLFPRLLTSMLTVGERTSTVEQIFKTFANFYDDEIDHALKDLTTILEPALLLVMGLIIGGLALSILVPIYQFIGSVGG